MPHPEPQIPPLVHGQAPVVAFQGAIGAFSHEAVELLWNGAATALPQPDFTAAVHAVLNGDATHAVLPVDNTTIGPILQAREAIEAAAGLHILGHLSLPVRHALMAPTGASIDTLQRVLSHPAALAQCSRFFAAHPHLVAEQAYDTAGAAQEVAHRADPSIAAIAPVTAARLYGLALLAEDIQDRDDNTTSFAILTREKPAP